MSRLNTLKAYERTYLNHVFNGISLLHVKPCCSLHHSPCCYDFPVLETLQ